MNSPFRVDAETEAGLHTLSIYGELDQGTAPELRGALSTALGNGNEAVLIDLSDCEFIDSTGLSLLVEAKRRLSEERRHFGVCCPHVDVRRLLELTGIDEAVGVYDTRDEAAATLGNGSSRA
ncbi:MAG: anti-sigma factor antagonist [Solirubrobacterales bacterium]|nr:anti-sigma factor antagonist [Solirubrobacterales bacterium]